MFETFSRVEGALPLILDGKVPDAMARFNGKTKTSANAENAPKQVKDE